VSHPAGRVAAMCGGGSGGSPYPVIPALNAAHYTPSAALGFLSGGGVDITSDVTKLVRFNSASSLASILKVSKYLGDDLQGLVSSEANNRLNNLDKMGVLPSYRKASSDIKDARLRASTTENFVLPSPTNIVGSAGAAADKARVIMHAFQQGYSSGGGVELGGWDSHSDADKSQSTRFAELNMLLDFIMDEAVTLGIEKRLYIYVSSEFGRTSKYSSTGGKGHWAVGSVMVLSHNFSQSRIVGATDPVTHNYMKINPNTRELDNSSNGVVMDTGSVHIAMRKLLGLNGSDLDKKYPIRSPEVAIFDGLT
jgi:hypothetical protein